MVLLGSKERIVGQILMMDENWEVEKPYDSNRLRTELGFWELLKLTWVESFEANFGDIPRSMR
jgi:hypothetical protein